MSLVFLDLEASSLSQGSYPIEIGWVMADGHGESHLIRPTEAWLDEVRGNPAWDVTSEQLHGVPLSTLLGEGEPAADVARMVQQVLSPHDVLGCSDAPAQDGFWLQRLYEAAGIRREVKLLDVREVYATSCRALLDLLPAVDEPADWRVEQRVRNLAAEIVARAEEAEHVLQRVRHRALPDASALWRTHVAIREEVARHLHEAGK